MRKARLRQTRDLSSRQGARHPHPADVVSDDPRRSCLGRRLSGSRQAGAQGPLRARHRGQGWRVDSHDELADALRRAERVVGLDGSIVQELVPGGPRRSTDTARSSPEPRRLHGWSSATGASIHRTSADLRPGSRPSTSPISRCLRAFLSRIGYRGLVEIEYKHDARDGTYSLLDVNARTWGYHTWEQD